MKKLLLFVTLLVCVGCEEESAMTPGDVLPLRIQVTDKFEVYSYDGCVILDTKTGREYLFLEYSDNCCIWPLEAESLLPK